MKMPTRSFGPAVPRPGASSSVRVIGGSLRGSKLSFPDLPGLRPTPDRVRETLFNWLQPIIDGATCLDLFAGTGALGVEALSRGADSAQFIERDARIAGALRDNLSRLKVTAATVAADDTARWLSGAARRFDLVFLDPPFALDLWSATANLLEERGWLSPHAWIYVESPRDTALSLPATWQLHREGKAGEVGYALYRRHPADPLS
jgi:16S rRNA (guanine966-N2)-methyltransferase